MDLDVKIDAALADAALLGVHDPGSRRRDTANRGLQIARNPAVENVVQRTSKNQKTVHNNDDTGGQCGPVIRRLIASPTVGADRSGTDRILAKVSELTKMFANEFLKANRK